MAKTKEPKTVPVYKPGEPLKIPCANFLCREYFIIVPSSDKALAQQMKFVCVACGGLTTKFKQPEEKSESVREVDRKQMRLS